jgi:hypothetical protein
VLGRGRFSGASARRIDVGAHRAVLRGNRDAEDSAGASPAHPDDACSKRVLLGTAGTIANWAGRESCQ